MSFGRPNLKKLTGAGLALLIAGTIIWAAFRPGKPAGVGQVVVLSNWPTTADGVALKPVDMPVALLFDCYENALENVPPRTDTSKRQWSWEAPPLPMDVARRELTKAGASETDKKVLAWLEDWEFGWKKDYPTTTDQLWRLEPELGAAGLSFRDMFNIGLSMSFLDGDEQATCWYRAALKNIKANDSGLRKAVETSSDVLKSLAQMRSLWQMKDYDALKQRFALERELYPKSSVESRKSGHLLAVMNFYLDRPEDALSLINRVSEENEHAGDLKASDLVEQHWNQGLFLYSCGHYIKAIPHLKTVAADGTFVHQAQAYEILCESLARSRNVSAAELVLIEWQRKCKPTVQQVLRVSSVIEQAKSLN